ncbi:MAG TPA: hypothetical protein VM012_05815 [Flavitalea sp.]|nr:hypothetical protein [Flavitalea sp.]
MKPVFIEIIGTDNRKYRVNVNQILYFCTFEKKGSLLTEVVFNNKESIETDETPSQLDNRIGKHFSKVNGREEMVNS